VPSYRLYVDGASRGNPGDASIGASLTNSKGVEVGTVSEAIGLTTNNEAEYRALIAGLELAVRKKVRSLEVRADSELMVRQMTGQYRVKHPNLKQFWLRAQELSRKFQAFSIRHVPREENSRADELANRALDGG
jgi:ribonuclease HI/probable phosphoglycerate mutase